MKQSRRTGQPWIKSGHPRRRARTSIGVELLASNLGLPLDGRGGGGVDARVNPPQPLHLLRKRNLEAAPPGHDDVLVSAAVAEYAAWWPDLWAGLQLTLLLTFTSMALALVIGLALALARLGGQRRWLSVPAAVFVEVIRGSPLLLQLFYIFYVFPFFGIRLTALAAGILGLGINYGAYLSEVIRAGIVAVDHGQWEAARALGMRGRIYMPHVILPQALRIVIPPIGGYFISLFKDTALVSTISIGELLFRGQLLAAENFRYLQIYSFIFVIYLVISYPAAVGVRALERHLRIDRRIAGAAPVP